MKLRDWHEGAIGERGRFTHYKPDGKKDATYEYEHIDWDSHFKGEKYLGLSPVKIIQNGTGRKGVCRWIAWDLDVEATPEDFCRIVFKINPEFFCYKTSSDRWHIYHYLDEWTDVEECRKIAVEYEAKWKKVWKKGVDTSHSLPKAYNIAEGKPGYWMFQPYCPHKELKNNKLYGYSPSGKPLTRFDLEYAIEWRKYPIIRCLVGAESGEGGREKFLFMARQCIEANKLDLTEHMVNSFFGEPLQEPTLSKEIRSHDKKDYEGEYNEQYFKDHHESYLKEINGYWRKDIKGVGVLDGFTSPEQEEKAKEFIKNVIYIKLDDLWYDKSTGSEYKQKSIQVTYGHILGVKQSDVILKFTLTEGAQLVEKGVYRPDLFKTIDDPIVKDEKGLLQLNQYRPSDIEALPPDTKERKAELDLFLELVRKLTENEETGTNSKGKEINLYDYVLDHLSMPFQHPGVKCRSAILFHSEEYQVGKNTLFECVMQGLGLDNCTIITPEEAISRERNFLENQLVLIDEILIDGDYKKKLSTLNILKPLMTNELHSSRPLFKNWRQVHSTMNMMLFTNHKEALAVKPNEARYTIIDVGKDREEMGGDEFFNQFWTPEGQLNGTIPNVVKHFLSTRKISEEFDPKSICLKTNFLKTMSEEGGHPMLKDIKPLFEEGAKPFHQSLVCISEAFNYLKKEKGIKGRINDLAEAFKELGFERVGAIFHKRTGRKPTMWITKNFDFFCDKSMANMCNLYWKPMDVEDWNLSQGDITPIDSALKEIEAYEDFHRDTPKEDPGEDYETIRRERAKRGVK